jgi:hypothetical protein
MSCMKFAEAIADHAYGAPLTVDAAAHLAGCERCRVEFERRSRDARDLDAALRDRLAVEPSADFSRAVRARIAHRETVASRGWWWSAAAVVAAGLVLIAILRGVPERDRPETPSAPSTPPRGTLSRREIPSAPLAPPREAPSRREIRFAPSAPPREALSPRQPVVLVPPDQQRAIARLIELIRTGAIDPAQLPATTATTATPPDLMVAPLNIEPLAAPGGEPVRRPEENGSRPQ